MRGGKKREVGAALTCGFEALGHRPVQVRFQHAATYHKGKYIKRGWFCRTCLACAIGSPEAFEEDMSKHLGAQKHHFLESCSPRTWSFSCTWASRE